MQDSIRISKGFSLLLMRGFNNCWSSNGLKRDNGDDDDDDDADDDDDDDGHFSMMPQPTIEESTFFSEWGTPHQITTVGLGLCTNTVTQVELTTNCWKSSPRTVGTYQRLTQCWKSRVVCGWALFSNNSKR